MSLTISTPVQLQPEPGPRSSMGPRSASGRPRFGSLFVAASLVAASLLGALSACAPGADAVAPALDTDPADEATIEEKGAALSMYPTSTFYVVTRPDTRRCAYPMCGGLFTQRVNQRLTKCADGTMQSECRVLEFDYGALGLGAADQATLVGLVVKGQALLLGEITKTAPIAGKTYDKLVVKEAWEARALSTPTGVFARTRQLPTACPGCPSISYERLNSTAAAVTISRLVFDPTIFSPALASELDGVLWKTGAGVLAAGRRATSGADQILNVSEAYTRFVGKGPRLGEVGDACGSRGLPFACNKGLFCQREPDANCGRADAPGTCQPIPNICTRIFKPVCGCDGLTYGNECEAHAAEVSVDYDGPC